MKVAVIEEALKRLEIETAKGVQNPVFASGLGICKAVREVWNAFDAYALSGSGEQARPAARKAVTLIGEALQVFGKIVPTDNAEKLKLQEFRHSILARRKELRIFAAKGVDGFRIHTLEAALAA
jgi:hypothetical protein